MQQFQSSAPVAVPHNVNAPGTTAGARLVPMTASIRRPPSALRRLGTGADPGYSGGNPMSVNVQVEFRPVTQHGMTGMRTPGQQGPGRQLADTSFFMAELRNKITEIQEEIGVLEAEIETRSRDQSANTHLVRKYDEVAKTIEALEGQLADYNLAHDKIRSGTDIRDLTERVNRMEAALDQQKHGIDDLFSSRTALDAQRAKLEEEIAAILQKEEQSMAMAPGPLLQQYTAQKQEALEMQADLAKKDDHLVVLRQKVKEQESVLARDEFRAHFRALQLQQEKKELEERRQELKEECDPNLSVEQMRERLQVKAKEDGIIIKTMEEKLKAIELETQQVQEALHEREVQKENIKEFEDINRKYEALYQRDKAMQEFIDKFESTKAKDAEQKRATQTRIVALMEHISEGVIKKENLPTQKQVLAMESDLSFKSKELDASVTTLERVKKELEKRKAELEQISGLGEKIRSELVNLRGRAAPMENEIVMLSDVEGMKEREALAKITLQQELNTVKHKRGAIQVQVQNLSKTYEAKKKALVEDEDWKRLETLEAKLRTLSQTSYQLESHIAARKRESDFELIRDQVVNMVSQLNALIVNRQST